jgi:uncharacterized protein YbaP (TraB family)
MTEVDVLMEEMQALALAPMMMDFNSSLISKLGKNYVDKIAVSNGLPAEILDTFKPWVAFTMVIYARPAGYSEEYGVDILLSARAEELGIQRVQLEDALTSMSYIINLPEDKLIRIIRFYVDNEAAVKKITQTTAEYYYAGRFNSLYTYTKQMDAEGRQYPREDSKFWETWYTDTLVEGRTLSWIPSIEAQTARGSTFIAVGAAHLYDKNGLIEQLGKRGYKVSPILQ